MSRTFENKTKAEAKIEYKTMKLWERYVEPPKREYLKVKSLKFTNISPTSHLILLVKGSRGSLSSPLTNQKRTRLGQSPKAPLPHLPLSFALLD